MPKWQFRLMGGEEEAKTGLEQQDRCTGNCDKRVRRSSGTLGWRNAMQCNITAISKKSQILKVTPGPMKGDGEMSVVHDLKWTFGHENLPTSKW